VLENYFPILLFIVIAFVFGGLMVAAGTVLGPHRPDSEKLSPYECGFEAFEDARMKFDVRYYLVAILFILFDLEIAFLFPWAVTLNEIAPKNAQGQPATRDALSDSDRKAVLEIVAATKPDVPDYWTATD